MARINIVMQGKGGVGKSVVASVLTQYLRDERGLMPLGIDTDPINQTYSAYAAFDAESFKLVDEERNIDQRSFDRLLLHIDQAQDGQQVVVDSGASTFIALTGYLRDGRIPELLTRNGHDLMLHVVVSGGEEQDNTLGGLAYILRSYGDVAVTVWLNPFHGSIGWGGRGFRDMPLYLSNADRIKHIVELPQERDLFREDLARMFKDKLTFEEALRDPARDIYVQNRLALARRDFYQAIDDSELFRGQP